MSCQHPGQILLHQYLEPCGLSQNGLARALKVPPRRINEIILEKRSISADTAVRLAHYFGNSASYWMHLQAEYDIEQARQKIQIQLGTIRSAATGTEAEAIPTGIRAPEAKRPARNTRQAPRRRIMR